MISLRQNQVLYAIIGTTYGGNQQTEMFQLPNLLGKTAMGYGAGPGLTPRPLADTDGSETITLTSYEVAAHQHMVNAATAPSATLQNAPSATDILGTTASQRDFSTTAITPFTNTTHFDPRSIGPALGGINGYASAHENRQPYQVLSFCIALYGEFPMRP